jgi:hypothetical protein
VTDRDFTVDPVALTGDPFPATASERPCICNDGLVTIGFEEDGQTYFELLDCKRCKGEERA